MPCQSWTRLARADRCCGDVTGPLGRTEKPELAFPVHPKGPREARAAAPAPGRDWVLAVLFPTGGSWRPLNLCCASSSLRARSPEAGVSEVGFGPEHPPACRGSARRLGGGAEGLQHLCPLPDLADDSDPDPPADPHRSDPGRALRPPPAGGQLVREAGSRGGCGGGWAPLSELLSEVGKPLVALPSGPLPSSSVTQYGCLKVLFPEESRDRKKP